MENIIKSFANKIYGLILVYKLFVLYVIIGVFSASLDFVVFTIFTHYLSINYIVANVISVNCGIITSFTLNTIYNFKVWDKLIKRFVTFYSIGLLGLLISSLLLWLFVEVFNVNILISKLVVIMVITIVQFSLNKLITFKIN